MADYYLYSTKYADKSKIVENIETIALDLGFKVEIEDLYLPGYSDLNLYVDEENDEDSILLDIHVINESDFLRDGLIVNSKDYYEAISITMVGHKYKGFRLFLGEFLELYPEMLLCDESCTIFYSASDVINGKVLWLEND